MIGHLGSRVSALLDGQLDPAEEERVWAHVHTCHQCRDAVEREGWVKTRLAGLSGHGAQDADEVAARLRGTLRDPLSRPPVGAWSTSGSTGPAWTATTRHRAGLAVLGGGALSAAFVGVLALGVAPADPPLPVDRRAPLTDLSSVRDSPSPTPTPSPATSPSTPPGTSPASSLVPSSSGGPAVGRWGDRG